MILLVRQKQLNTSGVELKESQIMFRKKQDGQNIQKSPEDS